MMNKSSKKDRCVKVPKLGDFVIFFTCTRPNPVIKKKPVKSIEPDKKKKPEGPVKKKKKKQNRGETQGYTSQII